MSVELVNVANRLSEAAARAPDQVCIVQPLTRKGGKRQYKTITFGEFEAEVNRIASGLPACGIERGTRLVLMVPPSIEFIALTFALLKAGVVIVLIDPGMAKRSLLTCLADVEPDGFIGIPLVHVVRLATRRRFPNARHNITVGRRWFWGGHTLNQVKQAGSPTCDAAPTTANDPAAIIFTTGSTGPPKGVLYRHGNFDQQVVQIRDQYGIQPGERDLPGFPLFGLFNAAMGVTTVLPDMNFTRPATVKPENIIEAVRDWHVTQSFASPAVWNVVGRHCVKYQVKLPTLKRVLSAGAPVPPPVLQSMVDTFADDGQMHTPYGATEALPVATISAAEVLGEMAANSEQGAGTCVGSRFSGIEWKVIAITDDPLPDISKVQELPRGEIGELIVRGPQVTTKYITRVEANATHKITDTTLTRGPQFWHRMGDVGYLDDQDRFWMCGRKAHRVQTEVGTLFSVPCEAIFNTHPMVRRSALVGIGEPGNQRPVIVMELHEPGSESNTLVHELLDLAAENPLTSSIVNVLFHPSFPVDIRHNAKIFREDLAVWAAGRL